MAGEAVLLCGREACEQAASVYAYNRVTQRCYCPDCAHRMPAHLFPLRGVRPKGGGRFAAGTLLVVADRDLRDPSP